MSLLLRSSLLLLMFVVLSPEAWASGSFAGSSTVPTGTSVSTTEIDISGTASTDPANLTIYNITDDKIYTEGVDYTVDGEGTGNLTVSWLADAPDSGDEVQFTGDTQGNGAHNITVDWS